MSGSLRYFERNDARYTRALHGDSMDMVGTLHRALVVGNHDELRALLQFANERGEGGQAEFIERRVNLVHDAEGAWIEEKQ